MEGTRAALELVRDPAIVHRDGLVELVNAAFATLTGSDAAACVGAPVASLHDEATLRCADGRRLPIRIERRQLHGRTVELLVDLTQERERAELEARLRTVGELATDYHYETHFAEDGSVSVRWISDSYTRMTGWTLDDLRGLGYGIELSPPEDRPRFAERHALLRAGRGTVIEYRTRTRSGEERWVRDYSVPRKDATGRVIGEVGAAKDITEEKRAELRLRESEARYRLLAESSLDVITTVDAEGRCTYVSPSVERVLGYSPEELIGKVNHWLVCDDERDDRRARLADLASSTRDAVPMLVTCVRHKDGRRVYLENTNRTLRDENGALIAVFVTARDITARIEAEEALARAERLASLGRLVAAIGHEINNPLTYLLGELELLERDLTQTTSRERVASAREGALRIRAIVRDLRAVTTSEPTPVRHTARLSRVLPLAAATAVHEIRHRARLVVDAAEPLVVAGDEGQLVQVFVNLLVNAAQSITEGHAEDNEIRVVVQRRSDDVVVEVQDTGHGIAEGDAARIFEPFFTTRSDRGGTGLGLAIVRRIVSSIGGTASAEPRRPRGSTFRITLPLRDDEGERAAEPAPVAHGAAQGVLVIDDEAQIGRVVAMLLHPSVVVTKTNGHEAVELLSTGASFGAILCDLHMPNFDGADLYAWVTTHRPELARRIAFMTGGAFTERASALLAHADRPCLEKPFDGDALCQLIARLSAAP